MSVPNAELQKETDDKPKKEKLGESAKIFGPAVISAVGNVIGGLFAGRGPSDTKVDEKVRKLKDSKLFHWVLFVGIGIIALGAFIDGVAKITEFVISIYGWASALVGS